MDASGVQKFIEHIYPLPNAEYYKDKIQITIYKEDENEDANTDSDGNARPNDA